MFLQIKTELGIAELFSFLHFQTSTAGYVGGGTDGMNYIFKQPLTLCQTPFVL
jgi:hypothetical protein